MIYDSTHDFIYTAIGFCLGCIFQIIMNVLQKIKESENNETRRIQG